MNRPFPIWLPLTLVPVAAALWTLLLSSVAGPFWMGHRFDPDYPYLLNALALTQGLPIGHADHPGATLQWWGAIVLRLAPVPRSESLVDAVLTSPEVYLRALQGSLVLLFCGALFAWGWVLRKRQSVGWLIYLAPTSVLFSSTIREAMTRMNPEPLLATLSLGLGLLVLHLSNRSPSRRLVILLGLMMGLGLALKITFLPVALLPLILLNTTIQRTLCAGIAGATFLLLTANPLMAPGVFFGFTQELASASGYNAVAPSDGNLVVGLINGCVRLLGKLIQQETVVLFLLAGFVWLFVQQWRRKQLESRERRTALAVLGVLMLQFGMTAYGPREEIRYLIPALGLLPLMVTLLANWLPDWSLPEIRRPIYGIALLITLSFLLSLLQAYTQRNAWDTLQEYVEPVYPDATVISAYPSSDPVFALGFGNAYARFQFQEALAKHYPDTVLYNRFQRELTSDFRSTPIDAEQLQSLEGPLLLRMGTLKSSGPPIEIPGYDLWPLQITDRETLYQLDPVTASPPTVPPPSPEAAP